MLEALTRSTPRTGSQAAGKPPQPTSSVTLQTLSCEQTKQQPFCLAFQEVIQPVDCPTPAVLLQRAALRAGVTAQISPSERPVFICKFIHTKASTPLTHTPSTGSLSLVSTK